MTAIVLHLSDIHIKEDDDQILKHPEDIAACVFSSLPEATKIFILVSGDIAYSGKIEQYKIAETFLKQIQSSIVKEKNIPVHFVIAPGNHDCDFEFDNNIRQMAIKCLAEDPGSVDNSVIDQCTVVQKAFFDFTDRLISGSNITGDKLWLTHSFTVEEKTIIFDTLNLSWVSKIREEQGGIVFPHHRYLDKANANSHVRVVVLHHPLNWFNQSMYRGFRKFIRTLASIVVTGHEHQANVGENNDTDSSASAYIEGDVLQDKNGIANSAFNIVTINLADDSFKSTRFAWRGKRYESTEEGSWSEYRKLPPKRRNEFEIQKEFRICLDDPGANFQHPGRTSISLSDIYIYPDLLEAGRDKEPGNFISSSTLLDPTNTLNGVLLEGEEKVGRTSLLYRLYDEYHERGYVPLYVSGSEIKKSTLKDFDTLIKLAVSKQYGDSALSSFAQLHTEKKLLLLDNFDECQSKTTKDRLEILNALRSRFGHIVISVGTLFEVRELINETDANNILNFNHYQVQQFGFSLRHKLIKKWIRLGNDGSLDEGAIIGKIDLAEKMMDTVMRRNIIPSMPLYLLTLLQSMETGRSGDFKDSALGHYYDYLLNEGFLAARVPKDKLKELFDYCTEMAWYFHTKQSRELSRSELSEFNKIFTLGFHTVDFGERLDKLIQSKVLISRGGEYYAFRYPYIFYFLKGRYISRNLDDIQIREYIEKCSGHLYVRENANTILFLAHHSNDQFILRTIRGVLHGLFAQHTPVKFDKDTGKIGSLIGDSAKLKYSGTPPEQYREQISESRDRMNVDSQDGLVEKEESGEALSLIAQLGTLFKTVEILGQILKNQYSSIKRPIKIEILEELFSGPLRALTGFYELIASNPDYLVAEIDASLKKHHKLDDELKRKKIAQQIVARIIQFISLGFIFKTSASISSDELREDIHATVESNGTTAFKLIEMGVLLDSPSHIPREALLKLIGEAGNDVIALSLIHMLVIRHLYMFKTSEQDKQWLTSKLNMDLGMQHALEFKSSKRKQFKSI